MPLPEQRVGTVVARGTAEGAGSLERKLGRALLPRRGIIRSIRGWPLALGYESLHPERVPLAGSAEHGRARRHLRDLLANRQKPRFQAYNAQEISIHAGSLLQIPRSRWILWHQGERPNGMV